MPPPQKIRTPEDRGRGVGSGGMVWGPHLGGGISDPPTYHAQNGLPRCPWAAARGEGGGNNIGGGIPRVVAMGEIPKPSCLPSESAVVGLPINDGIPERPVCQKQ